MKVSSVLRALVLPLLGATLAAACNSSSSPPHAFPFTGSWCTGGVPECWQCVLDECPAAANCIASSCGAYWSCACACSSTGPECLQQCVNAHDTPACAQCGDTITACGQTHCTDVCRGSPLPVLDDPCAVYTYSGCEVGFCYVGAISSLYPTICTSAHYRSNDVDYPCASCKPEDLATCRATALQQTCAGDGGDAGDGGVLDVGLVSD